MSRLAGSLDANVIIRLLTGDIPPLTQAAQLLISSGKDLLLSDTSLIETIYALNTYYKIPRHEVMVAILELNTNPHLIYSQEIFEDTFQLYVTQEALSVEDCYLATKAKADRALPLWTFDKKLAKQSTGLAKLVDAKDQL